MTILKDEEGNEWAEVPHVYYQGTKMEHGGGLERKSFYKLPKKRVPFEEVDKQAQHLQTLLSQKGVPRETLSALQSFARVIVDEVLAQMEEKK